MPPARSAPNEPPIPLALLPELKVPQGKLTLITSPGENAAAKLILTNTTEKVVEGAMFGVEPRFKEVWSHGAWRRCSSFEPIRCADDVLANVGPALPPGHATVLETIDWNAGDTDGLVRYCQPLFLGPPVVTESRNGRYSRAGLEQASKDIYSYWGISSELRTCLLKGSLREGSIFTSIGELAAALELERAYDESGLAREMVRRWLEKNPNGFAKTSPAEMKALREVLARQWTRSRDEQNCLKVCLDALSQAGDKKHPVGVPARYPAVVWRYLSIQPRLRKDDESNQNPERYEAIQKLKASGNEWGASPEEMARMSSLAKKSPLSTEEASKMLDQ